MRCVPQGTSYHNLNSHNLAAQTMTDSLGEFELTAPPGKYHLAVYAPGVPSVVYRYDTTATTGLNLPLNVSEVVNITTGRYTEQSMTIVELVPQ